MFYVVGQYQSLKKAQLLISNYIETVDGFRQYNHNLGQKNGPQISQAPNSNRPQPKISTGTRFGSYSDPPPMPKFGSYFGAGQQNIRQS